MSAGSETTAGLRFQSFISDVANARPWPSWGEADQIIDGWMNELHLQGIGLFFCGDPSLSLSLGIDQERIPWRFSDDDAVLHWQVISGQALKIPLADLEKTNTFFFPPHTPTPESNRWLIFLLLLWERPPAWRSGWGFPWRGYCWLWDHFSTCPATCRGNSGWRGRSMTGNR